MGSARYFPLLLVLGGLCLAAPAFPQAVTSRAPPPRENDMRLKPGMILDRTTAPLAADYLPPEILKHYEKGEYRSEIVAWPRQEESLGPAFDAQTERNARTLAVNEAGTIIDRKTGKQPPYVYGTPFPHVDPGDPQAGVKILWNYFYSTNWWNGNTHSTVSLLWLAPKKIDREVGQDVYYMYYDGVPPDYRPPENPRNLLAQFIATTTRPVDLNGTVALSWRYRDADKRDLVWAYVPALRRVRAVSPANRSDGFMGSDMSQDDGQFFDGKPEDFVWKLVGEREILRFVDPYRLNGDVEVLTLPGGGWRGVFKPVPAYGFQDPTWTGVAWAPVSHKLALRKVWVVEGVPRDKYYLYGKLQLYIDQENWHGAFNRKFSWGGELLSTLQIAAGPPYAAADGIHYFTAAIGSGYAAQLVENVRMNRGTAVTMKPGPDNANDRLVPLEASMFDYQALQRRGK